ADDVALADLAAPGNPVHDLLVDRDAQGGGKAAVALERRRGALAADVVLGHLVQLPRGHARAAALLHQLERLLEDAPGLLDDLDLPFRLQLDSGHFQASHATPTPSSSRRTTSAWTSATGRDASTRSSCPRAS